MLNLGKNGFCVWAVRSRIWLSPAVKVFYISKRRTMLGLFEYSFLIVNYQYFKTYLNPTFLYLFYLFRTVFSHFSVLKVLKGWKGFKAVINLFSRMFCVFFCRMYVLSFEFLRDWIFSSIHGIDQWKCLNHFHVSLTVWNNKIMLFGSLFVVYTTSILRIFRLPIPVLGP